MKKILSSIIILLLSFLLITNSFAVNGWESPYHVEATPQIEKFIADNIQIIYNNFKFHVEYNKNAFEQDKKFPEVNDLDINKFSCSVDELTCLYDWDAQKVIDFLNADNKPEYLKNMNVIYYLLPLYYEGQKAEGYMQAFEGDLETGYQLTSYGSLNEHLMHCSQKSEVEQLLEQRGLQGYTPYVSVHSYFTYFIIVEKDNNFYGIYEPSAKAEHSKYTLKLWEANKELEGKDIYTADEIKTIMQNFIDAENEMFTLSEYPITENGNTTGMKEMNDEIFDLSGFPWGYVVIPAVLIAVIAAVCIPIILKKKKA